MLYITGDIHGDIQDSRFKFFNKFNPEDILIFLGDFGFNWNHLSIKSYNVPCTTLFIAGNHENYNILNSLPEETLYGGTVRKLKDRVYYLPSGNYYTIENKTFFVFGGAASIDRAWRTPYVSWWPEEIPTMSEFKFAQDNLKKHGNKVDYFLTHTCAPEIAKEFFKYPDGEFKDPVEPMIRELENQIESPYINYFGHHHMEVEKSNHICLFYSIRKLT